MNYSPTEKNICATCGTRYSGNLPAVCDICDDDRQYVGDNGQQWLNIEEIKSNYSIHIDEVAADIYGIKLVPGFAIGQKAHLVISKSGNIMWDCIPFINEDAIAFVKSKGGIKAIVISHPHYYSLMAEWAAVFNCPVYLHESDREWIKDKTDNIHLWSGKTLKLWDGISSINIGGHFPGSAILHLPHHSPKGILLTGDGIYVCRDKKQLTFMYSYPNLIPLKKKDIQKINNNVIDLPFDAIYGAFEFQKMPSGAKDIFTKSIQRYLSIYEA